MANIITGMSQVATCVGVRLSQDLCNSISTALELHAGDPLNNALAPGFAPLEYSFSTWCPDEFRVAAQLFCGSSSRERCLNTLRLARRFAASYLQVPFPPGDMPMVSRYGAFFGLTANNSGLTSVEAYVETGDLSQFRSALPTWLDGKVRPGFLGIGVRGDTVSQRGYWSLTHNIDVGHLAACPLYERVATAIAEFLPGCKELLAGTAVVTIADDISVSSVDLHAESYGLDISTLPRRLPTLRTRSFGRWATAIGGSRAFTTVVSFRNSQSLGLGIAVYAVPAWGRRLEWLPTGCPPSGHK